MNGEQILARIRELAGEIKLLVISGGEPLLQQKELNGIIANLRADSWRVEIETNGTITPSAEISTLVSQFNCSPKLSNCGDLKTLRVRPQALESLVACKKTIFKFVVASEQDMLEVEEYVREFNLRNVYLMPLGKTREELSLTRQMTQDLCEKYGFHFSDRVHVMQLGGGRAI